MKTSPELGDTFVRRRSSRCCIGVSTELGETFVEAPQFEVFSGVSTELGKANKSWGYWWFLDVPRLPVHVAAMRKITVNIKC